MTNENNKMSFKRHVISLECKIQILDRLKNGEKITYVAKSLNLNESTIRTIKRSEAKIRNAVAAGSPITSNMTSRVRAPILEKMEKALIIFIYEKYRKQIELNGNEIKKKACEIYDYLKENGNYSNSNEFVASKGWYSRFKNRFPSCWKNEWADFVFLDNMIEETDMDVGAIVELANSIHEKDVEEVFVKEEIEIDDDILKYDSEDDIKNENFTLETIQEGLKLANQLESYFLNIDPSFERSSKFKKDLRKCLAPYHQIFREISTRKKQIQICDFLKTEPSSDKFEES